MKGNRAHVLTGTAALIGASYFGWCLLRRFTNRKRKHWIAPELRQRLGELEKGEERVLCLSCGEKGIVNLTANYGLMTVCMRVCLKGPEVTNDCTERALRLVQKKHPLLKCRLEKRNGEFVLVEDEGVRLKVERISGVADWVDAWRKYEGKTLGAGDSLVRVVLVQQSRNETDLLMFVHHAFSDGISLSAVLHDLLCFMAKPEAGVPVSVGYGCPLEAAVDQELGGGILGMSRRFVGVLKMVISVWKDMSKGEVAKLKTDPAINEVEIFDNGKINCKWIKFSEGETQELVKRCREKGTTVTGALTASFIDAMGICLEPTNTTARNVYVGYAVDLRKRYSPRMASTLSYQVGAAAYAGPSKDSRSKTELWDLAIAVRRQLEVCLRARLPMLTAKLIASIYNHPPSLESPFSATLSNWGILPFENKYGSWEVKDVRPIAKVAVGQPAVLITTSNSCLTITIMTVDAVHGDKDMDQLKETWETSTRKLLAST